MRASRVLAFVATITVAVTTGGAASASHIAGWTSRITVPATGGDPNGFSSFWPKISPDGRYVVFESAASNLVPGDTNGVVDAFVRDTRTGTTSRVSLTNSSGQVNRASEGPAISADGRYVVFQSLGTNVVSGDPNPNGNVFIRDRVAGTTQRVGPPSGSSGGAHYPAISADGRFVAFYTMGALVPADTNGYTDIYLWTRATGALERVSVSTSGGNSDGESYQPDLSDDGRYVAFHSTAMNLVTRPGYPASTYVRDRQAGVTTMVSVASDGTPGNDESGRARISGDGRYVVFGSAAHNLVPDRPRFYDAYLHDRVTGKTELVYVSSTGEPSVWGVGETDVSRDGRYVTFMMDSGVWRRDRLTGVTIRADLSTTGVPANEDGGYPAISADGQRIVFLSRATNLVPGGSAGESEIYLRIYGR
jgi:Tol biopolymer transport system component